MNVTQVTRQVTDFSFTLSAQDLERYLADPNQWAEEVREQLGLNGPAAGAAKPRRRQPTRVRAITIGKAARNGHRPNDHKLGRGKVPSLDKIQCTLCPRKISRKFMPKHLATKHGLAQTPDLEVASAAG